MTSTSAEYMRAYRARRKARAVELLKAGIETIEAGTDTMKRLVAENIELAEEVARLKRLLAERPGGTMMTPRGLVGPRDPVTAAMQEFHPAPKTRK